MEQVKNEFRSAFTGNFWGDGVSMAMLTVLMETHNHESELAQTLSVLVSGAVQGLVSDVILLDHGSQDGTAQVADAAGCSLHSAWVLADVIRRARGEWLMLLEPGARPANGWIGEVGEYVALHQKPAVFSPARQYRQSLLKRLGRRRSPLEKGVLIPKSLALKLADGMTGLEPMSRKVSASRLRAELIPAWVARR